MGNPTKIDTKDDFVFYDALREPQYVYKIEDIIKTKLKYFQDLKQKIKEYKSLLG